MIKTTVFDAADYLDTPEMIAEFLNQAIETKDIAFITKAIGIVARAKGMTKIAQQTELSRESLYRSFDGDTKPEFGTVMTVLDAIGIQLSAKPKETEKDAA